MMRAMTNHTPAAPWSGIDRVLVDMDGTLLDLAFDNFFWLELLPTRYAASQGIGIDEAKASIASRCDRVVGRLEWYCLDHWSAQLGLDLVALKRSYRHLISYLPGATSFLGAVRRRLGKPLTVVTNAHPETIAIKTARTALHRRVDDIVCSHDLGAPKESGEFWETLQRRLKFDPRRTLLVDDSLPVLAAARAYGVMHAVAVRRPDSTRPARGTGEFTSVEGVAELA